MTDTNTSTPLTEATLDERIRAAEFALMTRDARVLGHIQAIRTDITRLKQSAGLKLAGVAVALLVGRMLVGKFVSSPAAAEPAALTRSSKGWWRKLIPWCRGGALLVLRSGLASRFGMPASISLLLNSLRRP